MYGRVLCMRLCDAVSISLVAERGREVDRPAVFGRTLSTLQGGNNTLLDSIYPTRGSQYLDEFYLPNKGFVALDTLMGTPVLVRANDIALM